MEIIAQYWWEIFIACFTIMLLTTLWMAKLAKHFLVVKDDRRSFSIFDLEFPATESELNKLMYYSTPHARNSLKKHLWVDFLFMPAAYICIALLCYKAAMKMEFVGRYLFLVLAALQALPWLFDVLENIYLLRKISSNKKLETRVHNSGSFRTYQLLVRAKFIIALTGAVSAVSGLFYFWIIGVFQKESLLYIAVIFAEAIIFFWINARITKRVAMA